MGQINTEKNAGAFLDSSARYFIGISGAEYLRRLAEGTLDGLDEDGLAAMEYLTPVDAKVAEKYSR